jgi:hypothetical protein
LEEKPGLRNDIDGVKMKVIEVNINNNDWMNSSYFSLILLQTSGPISYKGAFLFVDTANLPALNLYLKFGFKEAGCLSQLKIN